MQMPSENPFATSPSRRPSLSVFDAHTTERATSSTFLLGQVMFLVAVAIAFAAAGAYIGRDLPFGTAEICEFGFLGMVLAQMFVGSLREGPLGMAWLFALALLLGVGMGPVIAEYATYDSGALYQATGGTALTVGIMGSFGFATSRDLIRWMRPLFWALLAVFAISLVLILVGSGEHLVLNLAIYAIVSAYLAIYFQIIRRRATEHDVVWIATGVFISIVNIFLTLLRIFGSGR
jgi:modulator of FtsH protease